MPLLIVVGIIVLIIIWMTGLYNGLVRLRNRRQNAFADIDVQLRQRHDLVPQLVECEAKVTVVDNLSNGYIENLSSVAGVVEFVRDDLRNGAACDRQPPSYKSHSRYAAALRFPGPWRNSW